MGADAAGGARASEWQWPAGRASFQGSHRDRRNGRLRAGRLCRLPARREPAEVASLLRDWTRSDILLLRLALAHQAMKSPQAASYVRMLANRFDEGALRGDKLHLQEEARFELQLRNNAARALELALENWQ